MVDELAATGLRRDGHSYLTALGGKLIGNVRLVDGSGSLDNTGTAPNMVIPQLQASGHATGAGVALFKIGDVM